MEWPCRLVAAERTPGNLITRALRLVLALDDATANGGPRNLRLLKRVTDILVTNQGLSSVSYPDITAVLRRLTQAGVLVVSGGTKKRNRPDLRVAPIYVPLLSYLRRSNLFAS